MTPADLTAAFHFAACAHSGQKRRASFRPRPAYIEHPIEVADLVARHGGSAIAAMAAVLHDVIEESDCNADMIADAFGEKVASIVVELTNRPEWETMSSVDRKAEQARHMATASPDARLIKIADQYSNVKAMLADPVAFKPSKIRQYATSALAVVRACGDVAPQLTAEFEALLDQIDTKRGEAA